MRPGKYSRWSIAGSAVSGLLLIALGLFLLHRAAAFDEPEEKEAVSVEATP